MVLKDIVIREADARWVHHPHTDGGHVAFWKMFFAKIRRNGRGGPILIFHKTL